MREIRTSGSMRGRRTRTSAQRACALLYRSPWLVSLAVGVGEHTFVTEKFCAFSLLEACSAATSFERLQRVRKALFPACIAARSCT